MRLVIKEQKTKFQSVLLLLPLLLLGSCGGSDTPAGAPSATTTPPDTSKTEQLVPQQSTLPRDVSPLASDAELRAAAEPVTRFGSAMLSEWMSQPENAQSNFVFSPLSLYSALLMAQAGAENETLRQMSAVLQLTVPRQQANVNFNALDLALEGRGQVAGDGVLRNVNGLFVEKTQSVQQPFLDTLAVNFGAGVLPFDASTPAAIEASRIDINAWFKDKTSGKFSEFLSPGLLKRDARLVLTNAVTFQGAWRQPFDASLTRAGNFSLTTGELKSTQFMEQSGGLVVKHDANYDAVELPFAGGDFALQVVVPQVGQFQAVEAALRTNPQFIFLLEEPRRLCAS